MSHYNQPDLKGLLSCALAEHSHEGGIEATTVTATNERPVVVLDDDVQFLRMVERVLRSHGIRTELVTTPDLANAADVVAAINPRLVIVDVFMYGEAAGLSFIKLLRSRPENVELPIVVTSGAHSELARQQQFLRHHRCRVLPKPFGVDDLLEAVDLVRVGAPYAELPVDWYIMDAPQSYAASQFSGLWAKLRGVSRESARHRVLPAR